jgi:hypothetical protein
LQTQNYANHRQYVPAFHYALIPLLLLTLVGAVVNLYKSWGDHERLYNASLILVLTLALAVTAVLARIFALRAQDRAIRAEQNLRHFAMTGKLLDSRLSLGQMIGLRFASDAEFVNLARRAVDEGLSADDLKRAVKDWRADTHRV